MDEYKDCCSKESIIYQATYKKGGHFTNICMTARGEYLEEYLRENNNKKIMDQSNKVYTVYVYCTVSCNDL